MRKEILKLQEKEISIEVTGNVIASVRNKDIVKKGARVFNDGRIYSSSFVGNIDEEKLIALALENSDGSIEFDYPLQNCTDNKRSALSEETKNQDILYADYGELLAELVKKYPEFIFSGKANLCRVTKELKVAEQAKQTTQKVDYDFCSWYLCYKHKKSAGIIDGYFGADTIAGYDLKNEARKYYKYLDVFTKMVTLQAGKLPVVFVQSSQLLSKLLESIRADYYKKDIGLFKGMLGKKILNNKFTLSDVSYMPERGSVVLFDGDGIVRENPIFPLVKEGVFQNLICDLRNAKKYNLSPTGNGQRSFDTSTTLGFNKVFIEGGSRSVQDILNDLPECLIVEMAAGGDFTDTGDYSTPVQNGFLAKNGVITGKLPQITLKSSLQKMLGDDLIEISSNSFSGLEYNSAIFTEMNVLLN